MVYYVWVWVLVHNLQLRQTTHRHRQGVGGGNYRQVGEEGEGLGVVRVVGLNELGVGLELVEWLVGDELVAAWLVLV